MEPATTESRTAGRRLLDALARHDAQLLPGAIPRMFDALEGELAGLPADRLAGAVAAIVESVRFDHLKRPSEPPPTASAAPPVARPGAGGAAALEAAVRRRWAEMPHPGAAFGLGRLPGEDR